MHILDLGRARTGFTPVHSSPLQSIYNSFYNLQFYPQLDFIIPDLLPGQAGRLKVSGGFEETMEKKKRYLSRGGHFEDF